MLIVTTNPNLPDIVRFGHYCPLRFVLGDHACPQNTSNKSATSTTNKGSYQILTRRCEILQSTLLKSRHNRTASKVGSDTKCHSLAQPARYCLFWALRPSRIFFCYHTWPQNAFDKSAISTLLIRLAIKSSPVDMRYYTN
jgi:hypothetical protein